MPPVKTQATPLGAAHRLGSAAVRQDRRAGRRARRAAARAPASRMGRDARAAAVPRRRGRHARRHVSGHRRRLHARRRLLRGAARRRRRARSSSTARSSTIAPASTAPTTPTTRTTRAASRSWRAPRSSSRARRGAAPSVVHAHDWQAGLAPVYLQHALRGAPGARRHAERLHDPQPRVSGPVRAGLAAAARSRLGSVHDRPARVLGPHQLPEGRHQRRRRRSRPSARATREEIQTPEFGFGFDGILRRARRRDLVGILNGIDTRRVGSGARSVPAQAVRRRRSVGQARGEGGAARRATACRRTTAALARPLVGMMSRMVDQKGFDLIAAALDDLPRLDATFVVLGTGEPRYQDMWRALAAASSRPHRRAHRLRRVAGAPDRGRRRHVPDAVAVRAVRPEPDVQPALRHRAGRPRRRRPGRHGRRLLAAAARGRPASCSRDYTPAALLEALQPRADRCSRTRARGGRSRRPGCDRIFPGTVRRGSTSKYTNAP